MIEINIKNIQSDLRSFSQEITQIKNISIKILTAAILFISIFSSFGHANPAENLSKIVACLQEGKEVVMFASKAPGCFEYMTGRVALDGMGVEQPRYTDHETTCKQDRNDPRSDQRVLGRSLIKFLESHFKENIDPVGYRIFGGIYCEGLDLRGLHLQHSLILDRSVFVSTVDLRNFRSEADFSVERSALHHNLYIIRADIGGSVYAEFTTIRRVTIADSNIRGAVKLRYSTIYDRVSIENADIGGDIDISYSYFSNTIIVKNKISGVLDIGQTQARCSYDIRNNQAGGVIATNFGFGLHTSTKGPIYNHSYKFHNISEEDSDTTINEDPFWRDMLNLSKFRKAIDEAEQCEPINSVAPGSFVFVDNHIKTSFCVRAPRWLQSDDHFIANSNLYLNENTIDGAMWIDFSNRFIETDQKINQFSQNKNHTLRMFNISAGTLIINFDFKDDSAEIKINGLSFKRIYNSNARCEASVSLRASKPLLENLQDEALKTTFPPDLKLPSPKQILTWIDRNSFKATQPFAEFVGAFQQAGDLDGARDLKAKAARLAFMLNLSKLTCPRCNRSQLEDTAEPKQPPSKQAVAAVDPSLGVLDEVGHILYGAAAALNDAFDNVSNWLETLSVVVFRLALWALADHGYSPERIGWIVPITLLTAVLFFHDWLRVVGFSVSNEEVNKNPDTPQSEPKIYPIGIVFLFDRLLPAYKIRNKDYDISRYYVRSKNKTGQPFSYFWRTYYINPASTGKTRKADRFLDILRFLGLIYVVFILAALGKIVQ